MLLLLCLSITQSPSLVVNSYVVLPFHRHFIRMLEYPSVLTVQFQLVTMHFESETRQDKTKKEMGKKGQEATAQCI